MGASLDWKHFLTLVGSEFEGENFQEDSFSGTESGLTSKITILEGGDVHCIADKELERRWEENALVVLKKVNILFIN